MPWASRRGLAVRRFLAVFALLAASQVAIYAVMIARHSALYRLPDHRLWYYPLPFVALLCFGVLLLVEWLSPRLPRRGRAALAAALAALSLSNAVQWGRNRRGMEPWLPGIERQSRLLRQSLDQGKAADGLDGDYARFLRYLEERRGSTR